MPVRAAWGTRRVLDVNRNRSIEAHLANHGLDMFYGQGDDTDDPKGAEHARDTRLRILRVDRLDGTPLAGWIHFPVHLTTSAPDVDIWDTDLAGAATHHLETAVDAPGFTAFYTNAALGDLMPRFDSYNRTAVMDLHGRRIAAKAMRAWRAAGTRLRDDVDVAVRWTRSCYCGQEVEPGRRVSDTPFWGLSFFGGSEDGASIFHEAGSTEGRRLPEDASHPVHGRKIIVTRGIVHELVPEVHVVRIGNRLLLGAPGEPSVEMGRRFEAAVRAELPAGVTDPVVVGLANNYMGYLTTPEEYQMQHYEGGHTVYGMWTSLLARDTFVALTRSLALGEAAPPPDAPAELGGTNPGAFPAGDAEGSLTEEPPEAVVALRQPLDRLDGQPDGGGPPGRPAVRVARADGARPVADERHRPRPRVHLARGERRLLGSLRGAGIGAARTAPPARALGGLRPDEPPVRHSPVESPEAPRRAQAAQAAPGRRAESRARSRARDPLALDRPGGRHRGAAHR